MAVTSDQLLPFSRKAEADSLTVRTALLATTVIRFAHPPAMNRLGSRRMPQLGKLHLRVSARKSETFSFISNSESPRDNAASFRSVVKRMAQEAISDFIPVSVSTLVRSEQAGIDLFQCDESGNDFVLYCASDHPLEQLDLDGLKERGVHRLFIRSDSRDSFQKHLRSLVNGQDGSAASIDARAGALNDVVRDVLETQFNSGDTDATVKEVQKLGAVTAEIVCHDEFAAGDLFRVLHHDYATFGSSGGKILTTSGLEGIARSGRFLRFLAFPSLCVFFSTGTFLDSLLPCFLRFF